MIIDAPKLYQYSPHYLDTGDQSGNIISHVVLKRDNYVVLDSETINSVVVTWILYTLESKVFASIPFHEKARTLWVYLEKCYFIADGPRLQQLSTRTEH
ncbi:hypothetical protein RDABS01_016254 [Bienertia sinuspersici]